MLLAVLSAIFLSGCRQRLPLVKIADIYATQRAEFAARFIDIADTYYYSYRQISAKLYRMALAISLHGRRLRA